MNDWIHLEQIRFPCKIGTYWAEQQREQPLEVALHFALDLTAAAAEDLSRSIDYAQVLLQVETIARHGRWRLLESLSLTLVRWFLLEPAHGEARGSAVRVRVMVKKPEAVAGRALPSVEIERGRSEVKYQHLDLGGGVQQIVAGETEYVRVSRVDVPAGASFKPAQPALALPLTGTSAKHATGLDAQAHLVEGELAVGGEPASWLILQGPAITR